MNICSITMRVLAILNNMEVKTIVCLSRKIPTTYSHLIKIINELEKTKIIKTEAKGRARFIIPIKEYQDLYNQMFLFIVTVDKTKDNEKK